MNRENCKLCGQVLATKQAIASVRAHGESRRKLDNKQRAALRRALVNRAVNLAADKKAASISAIARTADCSRRTVLRELDWLKADGTLAATLERKGLA